MGKMSNKGIFFTFISIMIMAIFLLVFTPQAGISVQKDTQAVNARIAAVDNYVGDLSTYFETVLRTSAYKTILSMIFYINSTGSYLEDFDAAFSEIIMTGKINGTPIDSVTGKQIMGNDTISGWNERIASTAKDTLNVDTEITVLNVSAFQSKPWEIGSRMSVNFTVRSNVAEWNKIDTIAVSVSLEGMHDPYYLANTNGEYTNQVKKSTIGITEEWNITKVREHLRNGTYIHLDNSNAPSFLMRLTNTISNSSCCGIESLVNPNRISPSDQAESYADYSFWSHEFQNECSQLYNITGLWDEFRYFKLDFEHVIRYNITAQDAVQAC
ncbi:hypothetical protein HYV80_07485 [Candidatus Woesearchaeota archaeon]|nr:hypothetical protein [Candidatus Woesearchaeota archaeon]